MVDFTVGAKSVAVGVPTGTAGGGPRQESLVKRLAWYGECHHIGEGVVHVLVTFGGEGIIVALDLFFKRCYVEVGLVFRYRNQNKGRRNRGCSDFLANRLEMLSGVFICL